MCIYKHILYQFSLFIIQPLCGWIRNEFSTPHVMRGYSNLIPLGFIQVYSVGIYSNLIPLGFIQVYTVGIYSILILLGFIYVYLDGIYSSSS